MLVEVVAARTRFICYRLVAWIRSAKLIGFGFDRARQEEGNTGSMVPGECEGIRLVTRSRDELSRSAGGHVSVPSVWIVSVWLRRSGRKYECLAVWCKREASVIVSRLLGSRLGRVVVFFRSSLFLIGVYLMGLVVRYVDVPLMV